MTAFVHKHEVILKRPEVQTRTGISRSSGSTLPARKRLISLETDFKAQTTNWVFPDQTGSVVLTPMRQTTTSERG